MKANCAISNCICSVSVCSPVRCRLDSHLAIWSANKCGYPPLPVDGHVIQSSKLSDQSPNVDQVTYKCDQGYQLVGNATNVCDSRTGKPPPCRMKEWYENFIQTQKRITGMVLVKSNSLIIISIFVVWNLQIKTTTS